MIAEFLVWTYVLFIDQQSIYCSVTETKLLGTVEFEDFIQQFEEKLERFQESRIWKKKGNTYPVKSINRHCFKGPSHHGVLFQNLIEVVHRERIQAAVCICSYTGSSTALGQKANLCEKKNSTHTENKEVSEPCET